jgi:hypothetical protein
VAGTRRRWGCRSRAKMKLGLGCRGRGGARPKWVGGGQRWRRIRRGPWDDGAGAGTRTRLETRGGIGSGQAGFGPPPAHGEQRAAACRRGWGRGHAAVAGATRARPGPASWRSLCLQGDVLHGALHVDAAAVADLGEGAARGEQQRSAGHLKRGRGAATSTGAGRPRAAPQPCPAARSPRPRSRAPASRAPRRCRRRSPCTTPAAAGRRPARATGAAGGGAGRCRQSPQTRRACAAACGWTAAGSLRAPACGRGAARRRRPGS